jgi:NAD-dependent dihydropyrimidine dehydrogenase PreA subunit
MSEEVPDKAKMTDQPETVSEPEVAEQVETPAEPETVPEPEVAEQVETPAEPETVPEPEVAEQVETPSEPEALVEPEASAEPEVGEQAEPSAAGIHGAEAELLMSAASEAAGATKPKDGKVGSVMVLGAGIAGIQSALDLAEMGFKVYLVESQSSIGGVMPQLDKTFPTNDCAMCLLSPKLVDAGRHPNIEIITNANLQDVAGTAGRFNVTVKKRPRYVNEEKCTGCGTCIANCPVRNEAATKWRRDRVERG